MRSLSVLQPLSFLLLRFGLGIIFISHGYPKLVHAGVAGPGVAPHQGDPNYFLLLAALIETFGGGLLVIGLFTRAAALLLAIEMAVTIFGLHRAPTMAIIRGYEFPLIMAISSFALATIGAGSLSLDHALFESGGKGRSGRLAKPKK
jgi:putative oxidoreductase